jgi:hypothetical protein
VSDLQTEAQFKVVLAATADLLKPHGFRKRAMTFHRVVDGNTALIQFQRSTGNDGQILKFTVNLGIVSGRLAAEDGLDTARASVWDAHVNLRIGNFLPKHHDLWWTLDVDGSPDAAIAEILALLEQQGLPYLDTHASDEALIALWESGNCAGQTDHVRQRYLRELKALTGL